MALTFTVARDLLIQGMNEYISAKELRNSIFCEDICSPSDMREAEKLLSNSKKELERRIALADEAEVEEALTAKALKLTL